MKIQPKSRSFTALVTDSFNGHYFCTCLQQYTLNFTASCVFSIWTIVGNRKATMNLIFNILHCIKTELHYTVLTYFLCILLNTVFTQKIHHLKNRGDLPYNCTQSFRHALNRHFLVCGGGFVQRGCLICRDLSCLIKYDMSQNG